MKNEKSVKKSSPTFLSSYRVYGIQKDRLDLTINEFEHLRNFILQMGNPLGVYETNYKVKKAKTYYWGRYGLLQTYSF